MKYPRPTDEQIRDYLAGNFCRCGCYQEIMQAIKNVAGVESINSPNLCVLGDSLTSFHPRAGS